jgi:hypothetical protein
MAITNVIAVHVADEQNVDPTKAGIGSSGDRASCIVEQPRSVGILEDHCAIEATELAVVASERRDLHNAVRMHRGRR